MEESVLMGRFKKICWMGGGGISHAPPLWETLGGGVGVSKRRTMKLSDL